MAKQKKRCRGPNLGYREMFVFKNELPLKHCGCKGDILLPIPGRMKKLLRPRCGACGTFVGRKAWADVQEDIDKGRLVVDSRIWSFYDERVFPDIKEKRGLVEFFVLASQDKETGEPVPPQPALETGRTTTLVGGNTPITDGIVGRNAKIVEQFADGMSLAGMSRYHKLSPFYVGKILEAAGVAPSPKDVATSRTSTPRKTFLEMINDEERERIAELLDKVSTSELENALKEASSEVVEAAYASIGSLNAKDEKSSWLRDALAKTPQTEPDLWVGVEEVTIIKDSIRMTLPIELFTSSALAELQEGIVGLATTDGAASIRYMIVQAVKRSKQERGEISNIFARSSKAFAEVSTSLHDLGYLSDLSDAPTDDDPCDDSCDCEVL